MLRVARLNVVPVKGLAVVARQEIALDVDGVADDRRAFLLRSDGSVATIRQCPGLIRVVPELDLAGGTLRLTFPDGSTAAGELAAAGEEVSAFLYGRDRPGRVLPGALAEALSAHVGEPLRLVIADRTGVGWDEGPVSLLGRASATAVDTPAVATRAHGAGPATARYRMLIEIDTDEPFLEDSWVGSRLEIGEALLRVSHPLDRCLVIHSNPATGERDWAGLTALAARRGTDRLTLGVIATVDRPGTVRVGDAVEPG